MSHIIVIGGEARNFKRLKDVKHIENTACRNSKIGTGCLCVYILVDYTNRSVVTAYKKRCREGNVPIVFMKQAAAKRRLQNESLCRQ